MIANRLRMAKSVSGGGGGFDPSQLSGLKLWLKADTGVTVDGSGNVSSWADQSGNGLNAVQTDAAKRPIFVQNGINGLPTLSFTGTQTLLGSGSLLTNGVTAIAVAKFNSASGRSSICNLGIQSVSPFTQIFCIEQNTYLSVGRLGMYASSSSFDSSLPSSTNQVRVCVASELNSGDSVPATTVYRVNGVPQILASKSGGTLYTSDIKPGTSWLIGDIGNGYGYLNGLLSELIVYDRKLTDLEILQVETYLNRYGQDPYSSLNSLILNMQGTAGTSVFTDESPNAFTVTPYGNATLVSDATFGTAASFDGSGDYLSIPSNAAFAFGTGDFTVEAWVNVTNFNSQYVRFFTTSGTSSNFTFYITPTGGTGYWYGSGVITFAPDGTIATGNWYHIAFTRQSGLMRCFVNGSQVGSTATNTTNLVNTATIQFPATSNYSSAICKQGPTRIKKGVALYTANFTPPTSLFPVNTYPYTTLPVSGAALWLDGADSSTLFTDAGVTPVNKSGDLVYQWSDKSGNNRHATQATSANRPTWVPPASGQNGFGGIGFDPVNYKSLNVSDFASTYKTFFIVHKGVSSSLDTRLFTVNSDYKVNVGAATNSGGNLSFVREYVAWTNSGFSRIYDATLFNLTYADSPTFSAKLEKYTSSGLTLIQSIASKGSGTNEQKFSQPGNYYEVVAFNRNLTASEILSMNSYLKAKWGTP